MTLNSWLAYMCLSPSQGRWANAQGFLSQQSFQEEPRGRGSAAAKALGLSFPFPACPGTPTPPDSTPGSLFWQQQYLHVALSLPRAESAGRDVYPFLHG